MKFDQSEDHRFGIILLIQGKVRCSKRNIYQPGRRFIKMLKIKSYIASPSWPIDIVLNQLWSRDIGWPSVWPTVITYKNPSDCLMLIWPVYLFRLVSFYRTNPLSRRVHFHQRKRHMQVHVNVVHLHSNINMSTLRIVILALKDIVKLNISIRHSTMSVNAGSNWSKLCWNLPARCKWNLSVVPPPPPKKKPPPARPTSLK